ncbi:unnamed protein product, partial [Choristocarpus tenellus]
VGHGVVYREGLPRVMSTMKTFSAEAFSNVGRGDYEVPDRRGVLAKKDSTSPQERSKPFLHTTLHQGSFRDFVKEVEHLEEAKEEHFQNAFKKNSMGKGWVDIRSMPVLITSVLGRGVEQWILDRILKVFEHHRDGKISWMDLRSGMTQIIESARRDVTIKDKKLPEWLVASRKVVPAVSHGMVVPSCYQTDIGKDGVIPADRPIWFKMGMSSTTHDLFDGTTKETFQVGS